MFGSDATPTRWRRSLAGALLGLALVACYVWLVGPGDLWRALRAVSTRRLTSLVVVALVPLVLWGAGLHLVLRRLGVAVRFRASLYLFTASTFLNGVTPFGQVGGDPLAAALYGRALETDFETGLAAIATVNALNRVGSLFLGLLGVSYLGSRVAFGATLREAAVVVGGLTVAALVAAVVAWRYRSRLVDALAALLTPPLRRLAGTIPGVEPPDEDAIRRRAERFLAAVERLAAAPARLVAVFALGVLGQLAVAVTLWLALAGIDVDAGVAVVLLVIPLAKLGAAAPTPGGFGSAEALLATLLVTTVGVDGASAGAATLLYRGAAFWLPLTLGGLVTGWVALGEPAATSPGDAPRRELSGDGVGVPAVLTVAATAVALLVVVAVHRQGLLVEPDSAVVHVVQDAAVVLVVAALVWVVLQRSVELGRGRG